MVRRMLMLCCVVSCKRTAFGNLTYPFCISPFTGYIVWNVHMYISIEWYFERNMKQADPGYLAHRIKHKMKRETNWEWVEERINKMQTTLRIEGIGKNEKVYKEHIHVKWIKKKNIFSYLIIISIFPSWFFSSVIRYIYVYICV